jgi:UDP-3-O-[3-hydroxymyristoyl] N-acetylglucosamine deacetylase
MTLQKTINSEISCSGIGIHCGDKVKMTLKPAKENSGIIFIRSDVAPEKSKVIADYKNVVETNLGTTIANEFGTKISTIEHFLAAVWGCGIDNLIIEIDNQEVPIMDGSSEPFVFLLECAGIVTLEAPRKSIEIMKTFRIEDGDKFIEASPAKDFSVDLAIEFNHDQIKQQKFFYHTDSSSFKNDICRARTFGFKHEIEYLNKMGLAKGGSLENAILVDEKGVVNKEGLRYQNEFARHKLLDFIGDIFLAKHYFIGHFKTFKSGHGLNNKMLHKLLDQKDAWRLV